MYRIVVFVVVTAGLGYLSRRSFGVRRSHGFYRFFAWEAIAGLCLLNFVSFEQWLRDPLSSRQLVSWLLLAGSLVPLVAGVIQLRRVYPEEPARDDEGLLGFERTGRLVTTGAYRYTRHPMYTSLLLVSWGVFFKRPFWPAALLALCSTAFLVATARAEEEENVSFFGDEYRDYMKRTKRFLPYLF